MVQQSDIELFSPILRSILDLEITQGNSIVETWNGWPNEQTIGIMLAKPFFVHYHYLPDNVEYREVNDSHYWKAEYEDKNTGHLLACRF